MRWYSAASVLLYVSRVDADVPVDSTKPATAQSRLELGSMMLLSLHHTLKRSTSCVRAVHVVVAHMWCNWSTTRRCKGGSERRNALSRSSIACSSRAAEMLSRAGAVRALASCAVLPAKKLLLILLLLMLLLLVKLRMNKLLLLLRVELLREAVDLLVAARNFGVQLLTA